MPKLQKYRVTISRFHAFIVLTKLQAYQLGNGAIIEGDICDGLDVIRSSPSSHIVSSLSLIAETI